MSDESAETKEVFDVERIKQLIELMHANELSEVDLRHASQRIRLRRGNDQPPTYITGPAPMPGYAEAPPAAPAAAPQAPAAAAAEEDSASIAYVVSPMVGTFYRKPNPNAEDYVKVGTRVEPDTTVCTVEAMKMFNEIPAGVSGVIVEILVGNEEPVDVNKRLYKVDTSK